MKNKNIMIKTAAALTAAVCCISSSVSADSSFPDIQDHWAKEYIELLSERGMVNGMEDGAFHPDDTVTNAQFIAMIIKSTIGEIDPSDDKWYSGYMEYALKNDIITDQETLFPDEPITRQSVARIVHESLGKLLGETDNENWQDAEVLPDLYSCHTCVMHIAQVYVKGILTGRDGGAFHLPDPLTRAEAAAVIVRMLEPSYRTVPSSSVEAGKLISAEDAYSLMENGAVLIDVRNPDDYAIGHIKGSISIPIFSIESNVNDAMRGISYDTPIIVYCQAGTNSRKAVSLLEAAGFTEVYNLGGIDNGSYQLVTE